MRFGYSKSRYGHVHRILNSIYHLKRFHNRSMSASPDGQAKNIDGSREVKLPDMVGVRELK